VSIQGITMAHVASVLLRTVRRTFGSLEIK
jgi:hypothetical protein